VTLSIRALAILMVLAPCRLEGQTPGAMLSASPCISVTTFSADQSLRAAVGFGGVIRFRFSELFGVAVTGSLTRTTQPYETISRVDDLAVRVSSIHLFLIWSPFELPADMRVEFGAGVGATRVSSNPHTVSLGALGSIAIPPRSLTHTSYALLVRTSKRILPWMSIDLHPHIVASSFGTNLSLAGGITVDIL
jgi:hypothetical protein